MFCVTEETRSPRVQGRTEGHKSHWGLGQASWERGTRAGVGAQAGKGMVVGGGSRWQDRGGAETTDSEAEVYTGDPGPPSSYHQPGVQRPVLSRAVPPNFSWVKTSFAKGAFYLGSLGLLSRVA